MLSDKNYPYLLLQNMKKNVFGLLHFNLFSHSLMNFIIMFFPLSLLSDIYSAHSSVEQWGSFCRQIEGITSNFEICHANCFLYDD